MKPSGAAGFRTARILPSGFLRADVHHRRADFLNGAGHALRIAVQQFIVIWQWSNRRFGGNGISFAECAN
jgi:hypothetical protein